MGYIKHNAVFVTDWDEEALKTARHKAVVIYEETEEGSSRLITPVIQGLVNGQSSFFIAPDGSKEGWDTSDKSDQARAEFLTWLKGAGLGTDYIEVRFGGDDEGYRIVRTNDTDLEDEY